MEEKKVMIIDDGLINAESVNAEAVNSELITEKPAEEDIDVTKLAKPSCKHCHGTGVAGRVIRKTVTEKTPLGKEFRTSKKLDEPEEILCSCVINRVERMERFVEKSEKLLNEKAETPTEEGSVLDFTK